MLCEVQDLGRLGWAEAYERQRTLAEQRKRNEIPNQLLFVEHPHVVTLGRNAHEENILASREVLERAGIQMFDTNRGGDVTYHGPGQLVGYPILDLNGWKRDVHAYVRTLEESIIRALNQFGIQGERSSLNTGVWVNGAKICAIGVHISRWVTSHGFALNLDTDLNYFRYIVPCGLSAPVTSMEQQGVRVTRAEVIDALVHHFGECFEFEVQVLETAQ